MAVPAAPTIAVRITAMPIATRKPKKAAPQLMPPNSSRARTRLSRSAATPAPVATGRRVAVAVPWPSPDPFPRSATRVSSRSAVATPPPASVASPSRPNLLFRIRSNISSPRLGCCPCTNLGTRARLRETRHQCLRQVTVGNDGEHMPDAVAPAIERVAREVFGFSELRPGQAEAVQAIVDGRDTLAVMSTGYGKSAIYQIAAMLIPGPTVVVSPLIALQRDQIGELERQGAGGAAGVNSTVPQSERAEALSQLGDDELEFLFLSPEQLANDRVLSEIAAAKPSLLVVDEAHCISEWGHDFRPDYLRLGPVAEVLGRPPILALTATAAPPVREEIVARLGMREPLMLVRGFNRENIWLGVETFRRERDKKEALIERVRETDKPGIVYVATRKRAEQVATELADAGLRAVSYHAGLRATERAATPEAFMNDHLDVIVATTAFGMGVDKANVRFVFHYEISESVDSLYQQLGGSGPDRLQPHATLCYRTDDLGTRRFSAGGGQVDCDQIRLVAA